MTDGLGATTRYRYDAIMRLESACPTDPCGTSSSDYRYAYDQTGNMTSKTVGGATEAFTYNEANELVSGPGGAYTYDRAGNLTSGPGLSLSLSHNFKNQMDSVTRAGATLTMDYADATSDRRTGITSDGIKLRLSYNQLGLEAQGPNNGDPHASWWNRDPEGTLVSQMDRTGGGARVGKYYYLFDGLGSVVGLTDHDGRLVRTYRYDPYGKQLSPTPSTTDDNPWRFASGYYDTQTKMLKFGTRYYMPELARWTQKDPEPGKPTGPDVVKPVPLRWRQSHQLHGSLRKIDGNGCDWFSRVVGGIGCQLCCTSDTTPNCKPSGDRVSRGGF